MAEIEDFKASIIDIKKSRLKRSILSELYFSGSSTIAELSRLLNTSVPSTTVLVEELRDEEHWITEKGIGAAKFGRKPVIFSLNPTHYWVLIVDISTHETNLMAFNLQNEILQEKNINLPIDRNQDYSTLLREEIARFLERLHLSPQALLAIGVSMPGLINPETGQNYTYPLGQENESLKSVLEQEFGVATHIINDSKATVLGEYRFGLGRGKKHVLAINIDWGVGLGIMVNGELLNGASGFAGELGHIQMDPEGDLCQCGKVGCLDSITSASTLLRRVKEGLKQGKASKLVHFKDTEINIETVVDAANEGDAFSIDLLHQIGIQLGKGLSIAVHLFNPEILIVDGVLAKAGRFFINPIEQAINKYCLVDFKNDLSIRVSELGERSKLLGALSFAMDRVFAEVL